MAEPFVEKIRFTSGAFTLAGVLHHPGSARPPLCIGCHGLFADKSSPKQKGLARRLNAAGAAYLRFDHRGCGESEGKIAADTSFAGRCEDLRRAFAWADAREDLGLGRGLFGSSMGGAVCLAVAAERPVSAIAVLAAPAFGARLADLLVQSGEAERLSPEFLAEMRELEPQPRGFSPGPLLVVHATGDTVVPIENGEEIFSRAAGEKKMLIFHGADHALTDPNFRNEMLSHASRWLARRLMA